MVRTKADGVKVSVAKMSNKSSRPAPLQSYTSTTSSNRKSKTVGGNPYFLPETPEWQKPITKFFTQPSSATTTTTNNSDGAGSSKDHPSTSFETENCSATTTTTNNSNGAYGAGSSKEHPSTSSETEN